MTARDYFTAMPTACTIPTRGAMAIYCGDKPRKNADGTTSHFLRSPLLLMPPEMWSDPDDILQKVCDLLNANAHLFFDSAKTATPATEEASK